MALPREQVINLVSDSLMPYIDPVIASIIAELLIYHHLVSRIPGDRFVVVNKDGSLSGLMRTNWIPHGGAAQIRAALVEYNLPECKLMRFGTYRDKCAYIATGTGIWCISEQESKKVLNGHGGIFFKGDARYKYDEQQINQSPFDLCYFNTPPAAFVKRGREAMNAQVQKALYKAWLMCALFQCPDLPHLAILVESSQDGADLFHLAGAILKTPCLQAANARDIRDTEYYPAAVARIGRKGITFPKINLPMLCIAQNSTLLRSHGPILILGGSSSGSLTMEDAAAMTAAGQAELIEDLSKSMELRIFDKYPVWFYIFINQLQHEVGLSKYSAGAIVKNWWRWSHNLVYRKDLVKSELPDIAEYYINRPLEQNFDNIENKSPKD